MIDASDIYTPQRAQNIMTNDDVEKVYSLYKNYEDVIERVKVVTIDDIRDKNYTLAINNYIENKEHKLLPPDEVRRQYFEAFNEVIIAEEQLRKLLIEGGYCNE